jgi:hypothetical protein
LRELAPKNDKELLCSLICYQGKRKAVGRKKKGGMRRRAEAGNTPHELMAFSGYKTLSEVQRYISAADKKRLADSGAAKMRGRARTPKLQDQSWAT